MAKRFENDSTSILMGNDFFSPTSSEKKSKKRKTSPTALHNSFDQNLSISDNDFINALDNLDSKPWSFLHNQNNDAGEN